MCKLFLHYLVHRINHGQTAEVTLQNGPFLQKLPRNPRTRLGIGQGMVMVVEQHYLSLRLSIHFDWFSQLHPLSIPYIPKPIHTLKEG